MIQSIGLTERELGLIGGVFENHPEVTGVVLFGSRAMGTHKPSSDIDLAMEGVSDPLRAESIAGELEELPLPYKFDVKARSRISSPDLRDHIDRVGIYIYERP